jgi:hypothetical protein
MLCFSVLMMQRYENVASNQILALKKVTRIQKGADFQTEKNCAGSHFVITTEIRDSRY